MVPYSSSNLLIISETRACRPKYQTSSAAALHILCKDHTIPSLNVTSVWLCITPFTLKIDCSSETSPFLVGSPLKALNFSILPHYLWGYTGVGILTLWHWHWSQYLCTYTFPRAFSSLSIHYSPSPNIICFGVAMSHPVCTLWLNHISIDHNCLHDSPIFSPSAKLRKCFYHLLIEQLLVLQLYALTRSLQLCLGL